MSLKELLKRLEDDDDCTAIYQHGKVERVEMFRKGTSKCLVGFSLEREIYCVGAIIPLQDDDGLHLSMLLNSEDVDVSIRSSYDKKKGRYDVHEIAALGEVLYGRDDVGKREGVYIDEKGNLKRLEVKER